MELAFRTRLPGKESQPSCRQGPYYKTTTASWAKATRRASTLTRKASRQPQTNSVHRSPAKSNQGPVTLTPSTYDLDQQAPSHGPNITDDSSPTRISEPKCPIVNRLNYWPDQGAKTYHRQTRLIQLDKHPSLSLPHRPSPGGSPPTRSPLHGCTLARGRHQAGPRSQHGTTML